MKRSAFALLTAAILFGATSCVKRYDCDCTYVPNTIIGAPGGNIDERSEVRGRILEDAQDECRRMESKYNSQNYNGTCVVD